MAQIVIPENLKPKDGRFGCGPSKMRPEQITSFVQFAQGAHGNLAPPNANQESGRRNEAGPK
jgi:hypothetical protein